MANKKKQKFKLYGFRAYYKTTISNLDGSKESPLWVEIPQRDNEFNWFTTKRVRDEAAQANLTAFTKETQHLVMVENTERTISSYAQDKGAM